MSKELIAVFILAFWLSYPIPMYYMNVGNFMTLNLDRLENVKEPTFLDQVSFYGSAIGSYFQLMYMTIPGIPTVVLPFIILLQLLSILVIILIIRG